jgi:8-oxo-dGTP pyrophosphatase MutT (NUDIX family)
VIEPWPTISSKPLADYRVFSVRGVTRRSPRTGREHNFFVIDAARWVNVIALTPDRQMVLVEQFRQGSETVELEIPGGIMDAGDATPEVTAARELREETGYTGGAPRVIGTFFPNPALMSNTCYTVLIDNCSLTAPTAFDHAEDLATSLRPIDEVRALVAAGKIRHCIVVAALYQFDLWRERHKA